MKRSMSVLALGLSLLVSGCANIEAQREKYVSAHPELSDEIRCAILTGELDQGMSKEQVRAAWGKPLDVTKQEDGEALIERWKYGYQQADMRNGLYFGTTTVTTGEAIFRNDELVGFTKEPAPPAP